MPEETNERPTERQYDKIIIGAGLYGLYAAEYTGKKGEAVLVLEYDEAPFKRATYANQARVHLGYHYPRSFATAKKSAGYFDRFNTAYATCIHSTFEKIYATSKQFSWTEAHQFEKFCHAVGIPCTPIATQRIFKEGMCDGAFQTREYTYDANILRETMLASIEPLDGVTIQYGARIKQIESCDHLYRITLETGETLTAPFLLNATYASINQIITKMDFQPFKIKYELCEIILVTPNDALAPLGITVMDGPFFSIMPFGKTGLHSLTSVTFTPHKTSFDVLPTFPCQAQSKGYCTPEQLGNCNDCPSKPESAWPYMSSLAKKYLKPDFDFEYVGSLYAIKPILTVSEIDDSRPTLVKVFSESPTFVSVLSGKINAVYDLEEVLDQYGSTK
ncbi:FAD-dependent oxidoreductase [Fusibacter paucivorans]|uniref:FAD-dependent oxidoreductase n=2 Tax=Fusibacter paucivorans TaxID=76009 RepID=A0ABS5PNP8_9FIRM|nr:FAD-dependent oxidoreductase [Fusibacter paucivorans]MBS7526799.1 FAD-dependent oxidoreductase [Fusibacter paucivorans]